MSQDEELIIPQTLLIRLADGQIQEMPLDEYLKGVVPSEIGLAKPLEALKAQAIAARSYAVSTRRHAAEGFDLCTTAHCQVWKPQNRYPDSDRAVDETTGLVVTYNGKVVSAPFFGHCDGRTRNSEEVWSGKIAYCRSVPCICGYTSLYGHGVGMCQRGAVAMAQQGATAEEILTHYYTGVEILRATIIPRTAFRRSVIFGQVVDGQGQPRGGLRLVLEGPTGAIQKGTTGDGKFWFTGLPAGRWALQVKDRPVRYSDLVTDGRNTIQLQVVVADAPFVPVPEPVPAPEPMPAPEPAPVPDWQLDVMPLIYPRHLIGTLGQEGIPVTLIDPAGNEQAAISGSAPEYNPGGFAFPLSGAGAYTLRVPGRSFPIQVGDGGIWVRFTTRSP